MGQIGFLGGSFNPIHHGHLNLAQSALEKLNFDFVYLTPTYQSPFEKKVIAAEHRLAMVRIAVERYPHLKVCDLEVKRGGTSYTLDTLKSLSMMHPEDAIRLLISDELLDGFECWKGAEELIQTYHPVVATRFDRSINRDGFQKVSTPMMEISSTQVRERFAQGLPCAHLLPQGVINYIENNGLRDFF